MVVLYALMVALYILIGTFHFVEGRRTNDTDKALYGIMLSALAVVGLSDAVIDATFLDIASQDWSTAALIVGALLVVARLVDVWAINRCARCHKTDSSD